MITKLSEFLNYIAKKFCHNRICIRVDTSRITSTAELLLWLHYNVSTFRYGSGTILYGTTWKLQEIYNPVTGRIIESWIIDFYNKKDLELFKLTFM